MKTIKVGILGAGGIAPYHIDGVKGHPRAEVIAVADTSRPRVDALAKRFQIPRVYRRIEDLIADKDVQAVGVALPTHLHAPAAIAALRAGKHVLIDKPFAMNRKEAAAVIAMAKKRRRVFTVGMNQRFNRDSQIIRTLARRGEFGELYHGHAFWLRRAGSPKFGTWFCEKSKSGGGALLDIGVHVLDLCLSILDNFHPESVSGVTYQKFGHRGLGEGGWGSSDPGKKIFDVDDFSAAVIKLRGGASVLLEASWIRHQAEFEKVNVELFGTEGGAQLYPARVFRFGKARGDYQILEPRNVPIRYPHCDRMKNWLDAILGEDELECKPEQSLAVQKIIDGIYESSRTGREVRIR